MMLAAVGQKPEAAKYLDASVGAQLLPEEEKLIAAARRELARPTADGGGS